MVPVAFIFSVQVALSDPVTNSEGVVGFADVRGYTRAAGGQVSQFFGHLSIVNMTHPGVSPRMSSPRPDRCGGKNQQLPLETTEQWQQENAIPIAFSGAFQRAKKRYLYGCEEPPTPYRNEGLTIGEALYERAPVLALSEENPAFIGYANTLPNNYPLVMSGNWINGRGDQLVRPLLIEKSTFRPLEGQDITEAHRLGGIQRHPRLVVGSVAGGGILIILYIEGRTARSQGISLEGAANILLSCGAEWGINLDGGGAAQMRYEPRFMEREIPLAIDVHSLCKDVQGPTTVARYYNVDLKTKFYSAAIDECHPDYGTCPPSGRQYRPVGINFGFDIKAARGNKNATPKEGKARPKEETRP